MSKRGFIFRILSIVAIAASLLSQPGAISLAQEQSRIQLAVDTANFNQDGVLALFGGLRMGGEIGLPVGAGDLNGDDRADVVFCEMYGSAGPGIRRNNGQVNIYISDGRDSGFVNAAQDPPNIFKIFGERSGDLLGTSVSANGDINGDGLRDIAIGASGHDRPGQPIDENSGAAYIVLGSHNFNLNADLATADGNPPPGVIEILSPQSGARAGIWIDEGDIDGDGFADIIIGADQINSSAGDHVGGAYIVFGSTALPQVIDLAAPPVGVRTARILGRAREDHWGAALQVGDINNDGLGDIIIGGSIFRDSASYVTPDDQDSGHDARGADFSGRLNCGAVAVVYGSRAFPQTVDLSAPPANTTMVFGAQAGDLLGSQVHFGDLNGDGRTDLIMGALQALAPDNRGRTGAVYIVYGSPNVSGAAIDLADTAASGLQITTIYGENHLDCGGDSVRSFDINKDGMSDLFIGSPEHTLEPDDLNGLPEREEAGDTKFIFGRRDFLPSVIKLYDPPADIQVFRLAGGDEEDEFSYRLTGGDVDGDGYVDYIANAMHADGLNNAVINAGDVYIFSGKKLSARLGMLAPEAAPTPVITSATLLVNNQPAQQASAGQSGLRIRIRGSNLRQDTEVTINGIKVISHLPEPAPDFPEIFVELDENPAIRNSAGPLVVRLRNTNPAPSAFSNEVVAGRLIGPEITSIGFKKKGSGLLILKISGANFPTNATVEVRANNQLVSLKSASVDASDFIRVKISASNAPPSGTVLRVKVISATGIASNEFTATVP